MQVHVLIEHCLLRKFDALQTEAALVYYGIAPCFTRIGEGSYCPSLLQRCPLA